MVGMKIGVFDSGIGGKSIADHLKTVYPDAEILYVDDRKNVPYGNRTNEEVVALTDAAIQPLLHSQCDVIVLACNTATAAAIDTLRATYPKTPFVGLEPMVNTAAGLTKSGVIAVCATPSTLQSERYQSLKDRFASDHTIIEPDCSDWASMIEHDEVDEGRIAAIVNEACSAGADVIVLACTHYHWIKEQITELSQGCALVIDPSDAIARQVGVVLGNR